MELYNLYYGVKVITNEAFYSGLDVLQWNVLILDKKSIFRGLFYDMCHFNIKVYIRNENWLK